MSDPVAKRRPLAGLKPVAEDDPRYRRSYPGLRQSLAATGINNVPIFHKADGDIIDGNTRWFAMFDLGLKDCIAIELPSDWTETQILRFSIATDGVRRVLPPEELAAKAERFIELTESTQEAAARELGISPAHLSRAITSTLLPAKHADKAKLLKASVRAAIAAVKVSAIQDGAMTFATTPDAKGNLPTRDAVLLWLKRQTQGNKRGRKPKHTKVTAEGGVELVFPSGMAVPTLVTTDSGILLVIPVDVDYEQVDTDLKAALARIRRGKKISEADVEPVMLPAS